MGRKSKATKTRVQNLSRKPTVEEVDDEEQPTRCNQVQVTVPTADLDLDDIIAQLGIETLPDLDEDEEDDEGLTKDAEDDADIMEISKLEVFAAADRWCSGYITTLSAVGVLHQKVGGSIPSQCSYLGFDP
jgi:hypothetical protein